MNIYTMYIHTFNHMIYVYIYLHILNYVVKDTHIKGEKALLACESDFAPWKKQLPRHVNLILHCGRDSSPGM